MMVMELLRPAQRVPFIKTLMAIPTVTQLLHNLPVARHPDMSPIAPTVMIPMPMQSQDPQHVPLLTEVMVVLTIIVTAQALDVPRCWEAALRAVLQPVSPTALAVVHVPAHTLRPAQ